jgi:hypothetical protein
VYPLALPIELLGQGSPNQPLVASAQLAIPAGQLSSVTQLYVRCHRCAFYEAPEFETLAMPVTKVKASLRIMGTSSDDSVPWIDITDQNVTLTRTGVAHGGLKGADRTLDFWIKLDSTTLSRLGGLPAMNTVQFRFNGTDGLSAGYRVLDVDLQDDNNKSQTTRTKQWADISGQKAATHAAGDVTAGQTLWSQENSLKKSVLVNRTIVASCADCHEDGRDLQYFNFSDNSIVQRSVFHGLTVAQGGQIVAFLRESLRSKVTDVPAAAPWNPPYQPGPGLDCYDSACTNNAGWAAGAGIDAVLPDGASAFRALVGAPNDGSPITQAQIDAVFQVSSTDLNVRETPIAMQFPDWLDWLPQIHPMEVWTGQTLSGTSSSGNPLSTVLWSQQGAATGYEAVKKALAGFEDPGNPGHLRQDMTVDERSSLSQTMDNWGINAWGFLGGGRGQFYNTGIPGGGGCEVGGHYIMQGLDPSTAQSTAPGSPWSLESFMERATMSLTRWHVSREWFLSQQYNLEGNQAYLEGDAVNGQWVTYGEKRGWPWRTFSAFYNAPHVDYQAFSPDGKTRYQPDENFTWNDPQPVADFVHSNQWYELQMTLNSGARFGITNFPMDWGYQPYQNMKVANYLATGDLAIPQPGPWGQYPDVALDHFLLNVETLIKLAQYVDNAIPLDVPSPNQPANYWADPQWGADNGGRAGRAGMERNFLHPTYLMSFASVLDQIQSGLSMMAISGSIKMFNELYAASQAGDWARCAPYNESLPDAQQPYDPKAQYWGVYSNGFCLDQERNTPHLDSSGNYTLANQSGVTPCQMTLYGIQAATMLGVDPARVATWQDWANRMWPM